MIPRHFELFQLTMESWAWLKEQWAVWLLPLFQGGPAHGRTTAYHQPAGVPRAEMILSAVDQHHPGTTTPGPNADSG